MTKKSSNVFAVTYSYQLALDSLHKGLLDKPPPPPFPFYGSFHFLIDSVGKMFFYQLDERGWFCGTGYDYNVPLFEGLTPNELSEVSEEDIESFLKRNILNQAGDNKVVCVGLLKDTIVSNGLAKLRDLFQSDTSSAIWFIRKATLEETIVVDYKKTQRNYSPQDIKWDTTKIKF